MPGPLRTAAAAAPIRAVSGTGAGSWGVALAAAVTNAPATSAANSEDGFASMAKTPSELRSERRVACGGAMIRVGAAVERDMAFGGFVARGPATCRASRIQ